MAAAVSHAPSRVEAPSAAAALEPLVPFPASWKQSIGHWWAHSNVAGFAAQNALLKRGLQGTGIQLRDYDGSPLSDGDASSVAQLRQIELGGKNRMLNVLEVGTPHRKEGEHTFVVLHGELSNLLPLLLALLQRANFTLFAPRLRRSFRILLAKSSSHGINT
jgi:hypothetical protein